MAQSGRTFLVECYAPGVAERDVVVASGRARRVVEQLRASGRDIGYLGALYVADDEAVFHQFRAPDAGLVIEASRIAELAFARVVESIGVDGGGVAVRGVRTSGAFGTDANVSIGHGESEGPRR